MAVVYIVILIGVLVFVHEFGHFIAARIFDVKVVDFSIGFGTKLFGFKHGDTQWTIRLLPLGGYVQMYGVEFDEVTDTEDPDFSRAYNNKPIWQKAIINLAGPLFNLLLPIPLLFAAYSATLEDTLPSTAGLVLDGSAAAGILQPGDKIIQINDEPIRYWYQVHDIVADNPEVPLSFTIERGKEIVNLTITPELVDLRDSMDITHQTVGRIGVTVDQAYPIIGLTAPNTIAAQAGLANFDEITAVNQKPVRSYLDLVREVKDAPEGSLVLDILRPQNADLEYGNVSVLTPIRLEVPSNERDLSKLGIASAANFITQVDPNSPASKAGLQPGDQILQHNGQPVSLFRSTLDNMAQKYEDEHTLLVRRNGQDFETKITLERMMITGEFQEEMPIIYAGMYSKIPTLMPDRIEMPLEDRLAFAGAESVSTTVEASGVLVIYIAKMFQGKVSTKSLGGPILIGHMAQKAGEDGIDAFLRMMAIVSINLGIINLVPIPLFDGGKLLILLIEAIKHGPLSTRSRQIIAYIGLAMVALLLVLAFKNDLERLWNLFFG